MLKEQGKGKAVDASMLEDILLSGSCSHMKKSALGREIKEIQ